MAQVHITVDASDAIRGVGGLVDSLPKALARRLDHVAADLQVRARTQHRYQRRTGNLEASTVVEATHEEVTGYIAESAPYGKFVHDGQRSWAPDPFLTDAARGLEAKLAAAFSETFEQEIMRAGLA